MLRVDRRITMGFFNRIFGGGDSEKPKPIPLAEVEKLAAPLTAPAGRA